MKFIERIVNSSPIVTNTLELVKKFGDALTKVATVQVAIAQSQVDMGKIQQGVIKNQEDLLSGYDDLVDQYVLLTDKYNDLLARFEEQQATNADLYTLLMKLATAMKEKGIDAKFPKLEFEATTGVKKPTSGGTN